MMRVGVYPDQPCNFASYAGLLHDFTGGSLTHGLTRF
jgi:hypothetical protein